MITDDPQEALFKKLKLVGANVTLNKSDQLMLDALSNKKGQFPSQRAAVEFTLLKMHKEGPSYVPDVNLLGDVKTAADFQDYVNAVRDLHEDAAARAQYNTDSDEDTAAPSAMQTKLENKVNQLRVLILQHLKTTSTTTQQQTTTSFGIESIESKMSSLIRDATQPINMFVGMMAAHLGDRDTRKYYNRYYNEQDGYKLPMYKLQDPIVRGTKSIDEFKDANHHLGTLLLQIVDAPTSTAFLGSQAPGSVTDEEHLMNLMDSSLVKKTPKDWIFGVLQESFFAFLLSMSTLGSMQLALDQVRSIPNCKQFTLKQLISSEGVRENFSFLCAYQMLLASGGSAYAGRTSAGKVPGTTFMISAGLETRNRLEAKMVCAKMWFGSKVYASRNPLHAQLIQFIAEAESENAVARRDDLVPQLTIARVDQMGMPSNNTDVTHDVRAAIAITMPGPEKTYMENAVRIHIAKRQLAGISEIVLISRA